MNSAIEETNIKYQETLISQHLRRQQFLTGGAQ